MAVIGRGRQRESYWQNAELLSQVGRDWYPLPATPRGNNTQSAAFGHAAGARHVGAASHAKQSDMRCSN